jgi:hypothetical protein
VIKAMAQNAIIAMTGIDFGNWSSLCIGREMGLLYSQPNIVKGALSLDLLESQLG